MGDSAVATRVGVVEAKQRFSDLLGRTAYAGERFIIERKGKPMAAIVSIDDLNRVERGVGSKRAKGKSRLLELHKYAVDTGIGDLAEQHDHYLYGTPKRKVK